MNPSPTCCVCPAPPTACKQPAPCVPHAARLMPPGGRRDCLCMLCHPPFQFHKYNALPVRLRPTPAADAGRYAIHFGGSPEEAAQEIQTAIAAQHPDKPPPPPPPSPPSVTLLAQMRTEVAVIPTSTGSQLVVDRPLRVGAAGWGVGRQWAGAAVGWARVVPRCGPVGEAG